jgi:2,3,4,5-tetrahydropyridine-2,6-dicarboxylate N-succinyltransferase
MKCETKEQFKELVASVQNGNGYREPIGFGICRIVRGQLTKTKILQATFPFISWKENFGSYAIFCKAAELSGNPIDTSGSEAVVKINKEFVAYALEAFAPFVSEAQGEAHKNVQLVANLSNMVRSGKLCPMSFQLVVLFEDTVVQSVETGYFKLYALSSGKAALRSLKLDGIFGTLHNCAWSEGKPYELEYLRANEMEMKLKAEFPHIEFVDKFPRYLQHIIPADNTRILDTTKVRFGAQIGAGTTIMPGASYVNFNAGTLGKSMIEGRVSSSAIVGEGSDVGGGGSILGVLSGTNGNPITIGENCLVGANAVCGIPMGDGSIIDAGIAILEGTKISVPAVELEKIKSANNGETPKGDMKGDEFITKGMNIGGFKGVHFRQDSTNGKIMAFRSKREIKLNAALH